MVHPVAESLMSVALVALLVCANVVSTNGQSASSSSSAAASEQSQINSQADEVAPDLPIRSQSATDLVDRLRRLSLGTSEVNSVLDAISSGNWDRFTPPPVTNPNCHVEVQVLQRFPGRCIRLMDGSPACQTQRWLNPGDDECAHMNS